MNVGQAAFLGVIQGLTEFLPVSSSGHLVLGETLLGIKEQDITFEIFVHFGTLLAVITVFYKDILNIILAFFSRQIFSPGFSDYYRKNADFRLAIYLIIGTIPAVFVGLLFKDQIEQLFQDPRLVCAMLIVTGFILLSSLITHRSSKELGIFNTVIIGIAQAFAILPGISRSGSTIVTGLHLKLNPLQAARFSFLLSIPAILGATLLEIVGIIHNGISIENFLALAAGTIAAYISGYIAIESLLSIIRKGKLYLFSPYCILLGVTGLLLLK
ncbi:undecaprenyl-diphosphate phosphatase [candidate division KSB1 bacterium]|nr:undecaprenyl-diphosphate phosphatase [candidate division KSB1 bacterium]